LGYGTASNPEQIVERLPASNEITAAQQVVDVMRELNPTQLGFVCQLAEQRIISRQPQLAPADLDGLRGRGIVGSF
jgi:hypothetical protein